MKLHTTNTTYESEYLIVKIFTWVIPPVGLVSISVFYPVEVPIKWKSLFGIPILQKVDIIKGHNTGCTQCQDNGNHSCECFQQLYWNWLIRRGSCQILKADSSDSHHLHASWTQDFQDNDFVAYHSNVQQDIGLTNSQVKTYHKRCFLFILVDFYSALLSYFVLLI